MVCNRHLSLIGGWIDLRRYLQPPMRLIARTDCMAVASLAVVGRFKRVTTGGEHLTWLAIAGYVATALLVVGVFVAHRRRERRAAKLAQLDSGGVKSERRKS